MRNLFDVLFPKNDWKNKFVNLSIEFNELKEKNRVFNMNYKTYVDVQKIQNEKLNLQHKLSEAIKSKNELDKENVSLFEINQKLRSKIKLLKKGIGSVRKRKSK